jgi:hypothetical protein
MENNQSLENSTINVTTRNILPSISSPLTYFISGGLRNIDPFTNSVSALNPVDGEIYTSSDHI